MRIQNIVVPLAAAALSFVACTPATSGITPRAPIEARAAGVTNMQPEGGEDVTTRIAVARCRREDACGHVGPGQTYTARQDCEDKLLEPTSVEVGECAKYDRVMLDRCVQDIRTFGCADPIYEVAATIDTCDMRGLCHKP
jgi:hypothetical protein